MATRSSSRKPTAGMVTLCVEDQVAVGTLLNVSVSGCRVATTLPLHKGQSVRMAVHLSNHLPMRIELGMVRWAADGEAGIEFIRMPEKDAARWQGYAGEAEKKGTRNAVERGADEGSTPIAVSAPSPVH